MARVKGTATLPSQRLASGLTAQQEAFCRGRAMGMSAGEALAAMGGSVSISTVRNWERKHQGVRDRIEDLCKIASKNAIIKTGLDREWVITRLMSVVERCMQAEPVMVKGEQTGEFQFDATGANQALRMLGDTLGMFRPVETQPGDEYANLSDDDLKRIAGELASQVGLISLPAPLVIVE